MDNSARRAGVGIEFARYGGYITIGDRMRFFTYEAKADDVKAQSYLGQKRSQGPRGDDFLRARIRRSPLHLNLPGGGRRLAIPRRRLSANAVQQRGLTRIGQ